MSKVYLTVLMCLASTLPACPAAAAGAAAGAAAPAVVLTGDVRRERTVTENGVERVVLEEPKVVLPGDRLRFTTHYRNTAATPAQNFVVTNAVPPAVALASDAAAGLTVSVDGGKTWGKLAALTVADGAGGRRPATATDVTHVRWTMATIAPGAAGEVAYRARVR